MWGLFTKGRYLEARWTAQKAASKKVDAAIKDGRLK